MKRRTVNPVATLGIMAAVIVVATVLDKAYSLGLVAIGGASLAVCSLVSVTLSAMLYNKFPYAIAAGALFGVTSFVLAYIFPSPIFQNPLASVVPRLFIGIVGFGAYRLARLAAKGMMKFAELTRFPDVLSVCLAIVGAGGVALYIILAREALPAAAYFVLLWLAGAAELLLIGFAVACVARSFGKTGERGAEHFALSVGAFFTVVANTALTLPMMFLVSDAFGSLADVYATLTLLNFLPELLVTTVLSPIVILGVRRGLRLGIDGRPRVKRSENATEERE